MQVSLVFVQIPSWTEPLSEGKKNWEVNYIAPWDAASMKALVGRPYRAGRTRRVALAANLADAITAADSFAKQKLVPGNLGLGWVESAKQVKHYLTLKQTTPERCMATGTVHPTATGFPLQSFGHKHGSGVKSRCSR